MAEQKSIKLFGSKVFLSEEVCMDAYLNITKEPVRKEDIYGQTLPELLDQLTLLSQILGAVDVLRQAVEGTSHAATSEDLQSLDNVQGAIKLLREVINEKFAPRVR